MSRRWRISIALVSMSSRISLITCRTGHLPMHRCRARLGGNAMNIRRQSILAGGLETSYLEAGPSNAEPLILLHDGTFGSDADSCWHELLPEFAARYRVLAPDLIGHGGTRKVVAFDRDPMTQRIDHIRAFCDTLLISAPYLVGSSFGGGMVLRGAAAGTLPVRAGVSIAGPGGLFMRSEKFAVLQAYEPTEKWSRAVCELMTGADVPQDMVTARLARSRQPGHYESLAAPRVIQPVTTAVPRDWRPAYQEALSRTRVPLMLVAGGDDELLEAGWAEEMASWL